MQGRMQLLLKTLLAFLAFFAVVSLPPAGAAASEKRFALVVGNASYKAKALATPVNDAALIAQTLQAAGFDVMGARDLDEDLLRQTFRDFTESVAKAGPDAVAAVYFAGYGLQFEGENYLVPIDANITEASDVPVRALRLSELMHALAALHSKSTFIILDVARASPFVLPGQAGGLAWVEPEANMLIAFNAAPGTVAPDVAGGYGPYAKALAEMIREGNLTPANLFDRVRLRVNELTKGAQVPWDASKIETQFKFFERDCWRAAAGGFDRTHGLDAFPIDAQRRRQGRLYGGLDARHFRRLRRFSCGLLARSHDEARPSPPCGAARGHHLATDLPSQCARCLLVLSGALSGRTPCGRCAPPSRAFGRPDCAALQIRKDGLRCASAIARRTGVYRADHARPRRSGIRVRAAATFSS